MLVVRFVSGFLLIVSIAGEYTDTLRDKRNIGNVLRNVADLFGYDVQKRPSVLLPPPPSSPTPLIPVPVNTTPRMPPQPPGPRTILPPPTLTENVRKSFTIALNWNRNVQTTPRPVVSPPSSLPPPTTKPSRPPIKPSLPPPKYLANINNKEDSEPQQVQIDFPDYSDNEEYSGSKRNILEDHYNHFKRDKDRFENHFDTFWENSPFTRKDGNKFDSSVFNEEKDHKYSKRSVKSENKKSFVYVDVRNPNFHYSYTHDHQVAKTPHKAKKKIFKHNKTKQVPIHEYSDFRDNFYNENPNSKNKNKRKSKNHKRKCNKNGSNPINHIKNEDIQYLKGQEETNDFNGNKKMAKKYLDSGQFFLPSFMKTNEKLRLSSIANNASDKNKDMEATKKYIPEDFDTFKKSSDILPLFSGLSHLEDHQEIYNANKPVIVPFDFEYNGSKKVFNKILFNAKDQ